MAVLSDIVPGRGPDGNPAAFVGDTTFASLSDLLAQEPGLAEPGAATTLAQFVSHFARGDMYRVIDDPAAFEAAYQAQIAREDPNQLWQQNVMRLRDFGVPDFKAIKVPATIGGALEFFARDGATGLPYQVRVALEDLSAPDFRPLPLTAIDPPLAVADPEAEDEEENLEDYAAIDEPVTDDDDNDEDEPARPPLKPLSLPPVEEF